VTRPPSTTLVTSRKYPTCWACLDTIPGVMKLCTVVLTAGKLTLRSSLVPRITRDWSIWLMTKFTHVQEVPAQSWCDNLWRVDPVMVDSGLVRWSETPSSPTEPPCSSTRDYSRFRTRTECTFATCVAWWSLLIWGTTRLSVRVVRTRPRSVRSGYPTLVSCSSRSSCPWVSPLEWWSPEHLRLDPFIWEHRPHLLNGNDCLIFQKLCKYYIC